MSTVGQISSIDIFHHGKKEDFWCIEWINIKDITTNKSFQYEAMNLIGNFKTLFCSFIIEKCLNKDLGTSLKVLHLPADVSTRKSGMKTG
jgi:hypothetical protein